MPLHKKEAAHPCKVEWAGIRLSEECAFAFQVLNEETGIADCLQYLKSLDVRPSQILVVDGGSTDR